MSNLIKTAPESIYLVVCDEDGCTSSFDEHHEVTWCADKQNTSDIKYIRADLAKTEQVTEQVTEIDVWGDLKFIQRVLESDAPKEDRDKAAAMARNIRRYYQDLASFEAKEYPKLMAVIAPKGLAVNCNPHPKAPHGFNRNGSHNADRYVCECEGWDAYEAGYQKGLEDGLEERLG